MVSFLILGVCLTGISVETTIEITPATAVCETEISSMMISAELAKIRPMIPSVAPTTGTFSDSTPSVPKPSIGEEFSFNRTWRTLLFQEELALNGSFQDPAFFKKTE